MKAFSLRKLHHAVIPLLLSSVVACGGSDPVDVAPDAGPDLSTCRDGVQNGVETDLDCGGGCAACAQCNRCKTGPDCETGNCVNGACAPVRQALAAYDPVRREVRNLVSAIESGMRCDMGTYLDVVSVIGREVYRFSDHEPRYTTDLLGKDPSVLASDAFYVVRPWSARYRVARTARQLQDLGAGAAELSEPEKKGIAAFARTIIAYQLLLNLSLSDSNGLRVDLKDRNQPVKSKEEVLAHLASLLDDARADLTSASFAFTLSSGFDGFSTPADFASFNRALAARVAAYQQDWPKVLTALNESFFNLNGAMGAGAYLRFTDVPGDLRNPVFFPPNSTGNVRLAHPSFAADITPGDARIDHSMPRTAPASQDELSSIRDAWRYTSDVAPIPIIRNEELILLYAEAKTKSNMIPDAIVAINRIRTTNNLSPYAGAISQAALLSELLFQRRYSLFLEGHRWVDARRFGQLSQLPVDRGGDDVWSAFPIPANDGEP